MVMNKNVFLPYQHRLPFFRPLLHHSSFFFHIKASVLDAWKGQDSACDAAKSEFKKRAKANGAASLGEYKGDLTGMAVGKSLFVPNHAY